MKLSSRTLRKLPFVMLALTAIITLLQMLAYLTAYDAPDANYFKTGSALPVIAGILAFATCVLSALAAWKTPRNLLESRVLPVRLAPLLSAIGYLSGAAMMARVAWFSHQSLAIVSTVLLLLAALHQALSAFCRADRVLSLLSLLGFCNVFACLSLAAIFYFDSSMEMNAPLKDTGLIGLICAMVYSVGELRYQLGKSTPRLFLMIAGWVLAVGALTALPVPIANFAHVFPSVTENGLLVNAHSEYFAGAAVILGMWLTAWFRFWFLLREPTDSGTSPAGEWQNSPSSSASAGEEDA